MQELTVIGAAELGVIGASCTLEDADIPARIAEWASLRDRATDVRPILGGMALRFAEKEPMHTVADLVARESACCAFYRFTLRVEGEARELEISAGEGREAAVQALLGL
jgi:hypothetical protein